MPIPSLNQQRIVIIGGSQGMGFAVAEGAIAEGASVVIGSSNAGKVADATARLGPQASGRAVDVRDEASVAAFFEAVGAFDHLVFAAGEAGPGAARGAIAELDLDKAAEGQEVRFWGALRAIKHALPHLPPTGSITLTDGIVARRPVKGFALGSAFAGSLEHLVRGLAVDLAPIRVNSVSPGLVLTERLAPWPVEQLRQFTSRQPLPRAGQPEELAQAYLFLMRGTFTTGQVITVDGGATLA